ncbi:MAG: cupin domain-containing protein [Candidatus Palauibacterales bacterium]|nr:cupin domain-containing protein [Candidatus Palauibacterales bacterium]
MDVSRWSDRHDEDESPDAETLRAELEAKGYMVSRHVYRPGTYFDEHTHRRDKIDAVVSGRFRMTAGGEEVVLEPGDWASIPAGTTHTARVLGDEEVVSLDATRT